MKNKPVLAPVNITIDIDDLVRIKHLAVDRFLTPSGIIREAVEDYLKKIDAAEAQSKKESKVSSAKASS